MIGIIQRVNHAKVEVESNITGEISKGLLVLLGVHQDDTRDDIIWMAKKVANLRIFQDEEGKMNRSVLDINGEILVVSQFTLLGDAKKGNRPSFIRAAAPEKGEAYYEEFCKELEHIHKTNPIQKGRFGAMMEVSLLNHGPVTIILDSHA